jgi:hypothetical protein
MNNIDIVNYKDVFLILTFMIVMIMVTSKLSPSYAMSITYYQVNTGTQQDKTKQIVDTNAFSNISRNMTFSTGGSGQSFASNATDTTSSKSPTFTTGGTSNGGSGISSSSTHHGSSSSQSNHHSSGKSISATSSNR